MQRIRQAAEETTTINGEKMELPSFILFNGDGERMWRLDLRKMNRLCVKKGIFVHDEQLTLISDISQMKV